MTQGHPAGLVDPVQAEPPVTHLHERREGVGLLACRIDHCRGAPADASVRAHLVVVGGEPIELALELLGRGNVLRSR